MHGNAPGANACIVSRKAFEERIRGVRFDSWADFTAAATPRSDAPPELQGSVVALDPFRIFTWLAAALINLPIWYSLGTADSVLGAVGLVLYGVLLYSVIVNYLESHALLAHVSSLLWPLVPTTVAVAGMKLAEYGPRASSAQLLLLSLLPHLGISWVLIRPALCSNTNQPNPYRASLVLNIFIGTSVTLAVMWDSYTDYGEVGNAMFMRCQLTLLSFVFIWFAGKLYLRAEAGASPQLVSWMVNLPAATLFMVVWEVSVNYGGPAWLLCAFFAVSLCLLAALFRRSFPFVLSALSFFILAVNLSSEVATEVQDVMGASAQEATVVWVTMLCLTGFGTIAGMIQAKKQEKAIYNLVRVALWRWFGVSVVDDGWDLVEPASASGGHEREQHPEGPAAEGYYVMAG